MGVFFLERLLAQFLDDQPNFRCIVQAGTFSGDDGLVQLVPVFELETGRPVVTECCDPAQEGPFYWGSQILSAVT